MSLFVFLPVSVFLSLFLPLSVSVGSDTYLCVRLSVVCGEGKKDGVGLPACLSYEERLSLHERPWVDVRLWSLSLGFFLALSFLLPGQIPPRNAHSHESRHKACPHR